MAGDEYTVKRGWGGRATMVERAQEHVRLTMAMAGEDEIPPLGSVQLKYGAKYYLPGILADLLALAKSYDLNLWDLWLDAGRKLLERRDLEKE